MKFFSKKARYLREGWFCLHETAMARGGHIEIDEEPWLGSFIDETAYLSVLQPLPAILNIYPRDYEFSAKQTYRSTGEALLHLGETLAYQDFSQVLTIPTEGRYELLSRFEEDKKIANGVKLDRSSPRSIASFGFNLIRNSDPSLKALPKVIWGIGLIGWASLALRGTSQCLFCPRRTIFRSKYCYEHGQSADWHSGLTQSERYSRYRLGKNAKFIAEERGLFLGSHATTPIWREAYHVVMMAEILAPAYLVNYSENHLRIKNELLRSPRVHEKFGDAAILEFEYIPLVEKIRHVLNPYQDGDEWLAEYIAFFETWFHLEEQAKVRKRGTSKNPNIANRINEAIFLASQGDRQADIAKKLNARESTVSMWANKYPAFKASLNSKNRNR